MRGAKEVSNDLLYSHLACDERAAKWLGIFRPVNEFEDTNVR
jgi:hypothetical protein